PVTHLVGESRRIGRTIVIVSDGVDSGAVPVAGSLDAFERPFVFVPDRKARRAVAADLHTRNILEQNLRELDVGEKRFRSLRARSLMRKAMARELMAVLHDAADEPGVTLGDPSQREEGRASSIVVQHPED